MPRASRYTRAAPGELTTAFAAALAAWSPSASAQVLERVSDPEWPLALGSLGDGVSEHCRIAAGRWVVFASRAANLVPDDHNASQDVFLRDRQTGIVERVSVDSSGFEAAGDSVAPDVSDDGRYVVFQSQAVLAAGAGDGLNARIYLRDRTTATTRLLSGSFDGSPVSGGSLTPRIDGAGTTVVFASSVSVLVPGDTNNASDIFDYDIASGTLSIVSTTAAGALANGASRLPDVADGGQRVVFASDASNLVANDGNNQRDIFLKDRGSGAVIRVSADPLGTEGNGFSDLPSIDASGTVVAFASYASNLVAGDTLNRQDVFLWDEFAIPQLSRASLSATGIQADRDSRFPSLGNSGRWVLFESAATNLVPGQLVFPAMQPFLLDRQSGTIEAILTSAEQTTIGGATLDSAETRLCLGSSTAFDPSDANGPIRDVTSRAVASPDWQLESTTHLPIPAPAANGASTDPDTSPNGRYIVFSSSATNLDAEAVARPSNGDLFWLDRTSGAIERWPLAPGDAAHNGVASATSVSADGRWVAFSSSATNLASGASGGLHVYRLDRVNGDLHLLSGVPVGASGGGERPHMSDDGLAVVFQSAATDLVPGDTNGVRDVFLWRDGLALARISVAPGDTQATGESRLARIAGQGQHATFVSRAANLVPGAVAGVDQIYHLDLASGVVRRASEAVGGAAGDAHSRVADISSDGRFVAFVTDAANLAAPGRTGPEVLRWDALTGQLADAAALLPTDETVDTDTVRVSDDGRFVAFVSILQVGSAFTENVWRADLDSGLLQLMSSDRGTTRNGGRVAGLALDAEGGALFSADDDALLAGDGNGEHDVYRASESGAAGSIGLDPAASLLTVVEGVDSDAIVAVVRSGGIDGAVAANFSTAPGSATSVLDFGIRSGIATFGDGSDSTQFIVVPILDDALVEAPEQFSVSLTTPSGGASLGPQTTLTITIVDNDEATPDDHIFASGFES